VFAAVPCNTNPRMHRRHPTFTTGMVSPIGYVRKLSTAGSPIQVTAVAALPGTHSGAIHTRFRCHGMAVPYGFYNPLS
jgi:hypothetical protein